MGDQQIERKHVMEGNEIKFLGVIIDNELSYISVLKLQKEWVLYWKLGKYSKIEYSHYIIPSYTHIRFFVFMYEAEPMIPIWLISRYECMHFCNIKIFI